MERAEIISKNQNFLKKADMYYRIKRLIDEKQMARCQISAWIEYQYHLLDFSIVPRISKPPSKLPHSKKARWGLLDGIESF